MHEMGHIADCEANRSQLHSPVADYLQDALAGWGYTSQEWHSAQFGEAIADAFAFIALYGTSADQPYTCFSSTNSCDSVGFNLETTGISCTGLRRTVQQADRYFWDVYDDPNDGQDVGNFANMLWEFPAGSGNGDRDEVGASVDPDGHCTVDAADHWKNDVSGGMDTDSALSANCAPTSAVPDNGTTSCPANPPSGNCPAPD
jgi:hypothetical protein